MIQAMRFKTPRDTTKEHRDESTAYLLAHAGHLGFESERSLGIRRPHTHDEPMHGVSVEPSSRASQVYLFHTTCAPETEAVVNHARGLPDFLPEMNAKKTLLMN